MAFFTVTAVITVNLNNHRILLCGILNVYSVFSMKEKFSHFSEHQVKFGGRREHSD
jgi:hypothetical protein